MTIEPMQMQLVFYSNIFFMVAFPILTVILLIVAVRFLNYMKHVSFELDNSTKTIRREIARAATTLKAETESSADEIKNQP